MQIKRASNTAGVYGKAVLEKNNAILQLLVRAVNYNTSVLRNGGRPPLQIILPEDSTEVDAESVSTYYKKISKGKQCWKGTILFKGAEAKTLGITPQDMAYLELILTGIKLTSGQYGVPLMLINFPEGSNRSVASEVRRVFYYTKIYPLRKLIAHKFTKEIIRDGLGIEGWKFDFRNQGLEESESSRRDTMTAMSKGMMGWNEGRIKMGLLPLAAKWANEHYLLGTKNDSLTRVIDAIGKKPEQSNPDDKEIGDTENAGEGADEQPAGEPKESNDNDKER
jgi:phage portal protein BeeE